MFACIDAVSDWLGGVGSDTVQHLIHSHSLSEGVRRQQEAETRQWQALRLSVKDRALQCARGGFGPVLHDVCADLTAWHGQNVFNGRYRVDNSCPSCGWFGVSWYHWHGWDGKFPFQRALQVGGGNRGSGSSSGSGAGEVDAVTERRNKKREEKQNLNCLVAHARQCGRCGFGPVLHQYCAMLNTHHGEQRGTDTRINNACPRCQWFTERWDDWKPWNGKIGQCSAPTAASVSVAVSSSVPAVDSSGALLADGEDVTEGEGVNSSSMSEDLGKLIDGVAEEEEEEEEEEGAKAEAVS